MAPADGVRYRLRRSATDGGIVTQWHRNGIVLREGELGDLAMRDGESILQLGALGFRFTAETIESRHGAGGGGSAVVLTLRQITGPRGLEPIHMVEFVNASLPSTLACEGPRCGQLAQARELADRTARRYAFDVLLQRAESLVAGDEAA